ncbi:PREDICTED: phosphatidylinositide phosphatase SAC1-A-like [Amphimedon queenslandica]|uniref:Phosphatidylinositol-3-phosphatase SAC1 n=1 Tax=Amphimedon queenslandica TaxID=400682 RepID=A0A1X7TSN5_AMPQE|nr:PREDICTED: phosphatidylinositide phosphatase SAC1-A-like [Amphimedon queenslandica]|eukprot:XP_019857883.1 PREDICTED: phosphatidylinositide phosphatase SAC1-A-like [Amphimedon queenslandica]
MSTSSKASSRLQLISTDDCFYLVPTSGNIDKVLEITKFDCQLQLVDRSKVSAINGERRDCQLLIGLIRLLGGPYLLVGTQHRLVGIINGHEIYQMTNYDVIPFVKSTLHLTQSQERDNRVYLAMIHRVLDTAGFYYSYSYDITHTKQRLHQLSTDNNGFYQLPLFNRADERFVWNGHLLREFVAQPELDQFCVPLLHGFISIKNITINGKLFTFHLISRRSWHRAVCDILPMEYIVCHYWQPDI